MIKPISIILSSLILVQSLHISFNDILQIDELVEHAQFHKKEYGDDLITFLSKHYGDSKKEHSRNHQEEKQDHDQLPFNCQSHTMMALVCFIHHNYPPSGHLEFEEENDNQFIYHPTFSELHGINFLQPPRLA